MSTSEYPCNNDPEAHVCACDPPCDAVCVFPGCTEDATKLVPSELIFGSEDGRLLKTDWGAGEFDDLLTNGGWDTWICENHDI